jgi:glycosyltransferase involved in cell wall biosynthesis
MNNIFLHLSHTDVRSDSRILKELRSLVDIENASVKAIGVESNNQGFNDVRYFGATVETINLYTKRFSWLPMTVRHLINFFELTSILFFRGLRYKPAVVHCHDTLVLPAGVLIKTFTKCKLIYDAHELESNKNGQSQSLSKVILFVERLCWARIDLFISVSNSILEWYRHSLGHKECLLILNSPEIDVSKYDVSTKIRKSEKYFHDLYDIQDGALIFVYLGIFDKGRGIEISLDAFASSNDDAHLVLIGYGDLSGYIQHYCDLYTNIHIHKPVSHNHVVELVASADIGLCLVENVSLSDYYCLPNKLFEYCFAGLHILGSDFPEIKKVIEDYKVGICCAPESKKVADAIQFLINHRPSNVKIDFSSLSWNAQSKRLISGYSKLINNTSLN